MKRTLVIGYGNLDRGDDGVAFYVVDMLRRRLGQEPLGDDDTGLDDLGEQTDSILLTQLMPELIDVLTDYDRVVFVDAHVRQDVPSLNIEGVEAQYTMSAFTHHMTPAMVLALLKAIHQKEVEGIIVSIRGHDFDFKRCLSPETAAEVEPAVDQLVGVLS